MNDKPQHPDARNWRIAVAVAQFNPKITSLLLDGCNKTLEEAGLPAENIRTYPVPGAWELPLACDRLARSGRFDAVIALGAVVRGETAHFDFISAECARGLQKAALDNDVPVAFGVLTPESAEQAIERADPQRKNKGREAALAALQMIPFARDKA